MDSCIIISSHKIKHKESTTKYISICCSIGFLQIASYFGFLLHSLKQGVRVKSIPDCQNKKMVTAIVAKLAYLN